MFSFLLFFLNIKIDADLTRITESDTVTIVSIEWFPVIFFVLFFVLSGVHYKDILSIHLYNDENNISKNRIIDKL